MSKAWQTAREFSAFLVSIGALLFVAWRGSLAVGRETYFIWGLVGVGAVALAEYVFARNKLRRSMAALSRYEVNPESLADKGVGTWFGLALAKVSEIQSAVCDEEDQESLPSSTEIMAGVRAEAERAAIILRWLSGAAVLGGLLGTLFGLTGAIQKLPELLEKVAAGNGFESSVTAALEMIGFCFWSSFCGVLLAAPLGLLRIDYETILDDHLTAGETCFERRRSTLFKAWRSPSTRMAAAAESLQTLNTTLKDEVSRLSRDIATNLTQVTRDILAAQEKRLADLAQKVPSAIAQGIAQAVSTVMEDLHRRQRDFDKEHMRDREAVHEQAQKAAEMLRLNVEAITTFTSNNGSKLQELIVAATHQMQALSASVEKGEITRNQAALGLSERIDALAARHESAIAGATAEAQRVLEESRGQIKEASEKWREHSERGATVLSEAATAIREVTTGLGNVASACDSAGQEIARCATATVEQSKSSAATIEHLKGVQSAILDKLVPDIEGLTAIIQTSLHSDLTEVRTGLTELKGAATEIVHDAKAISSAAKDVPPSLQAFATATENCNKQIATAARAIVQDVQSATDSRRAIEETFRDLQLTTERIDQIRKTLGSISDGITKVSQLLPELVNVHLQDSADLDRSLRRIVDHLGRGAD